MDRAQKTLLIIVILILVLGGAFYFVGQALNLSIFGASISNATIARIVDEKSAKPIEVANVFSTDAPVIYCSAKLSNAPANTEVKIRWIYLQGEGKDSTEVLVNETVGIFEGSLYFSFKLVNDTGWQRGEYKAMLYLNGSHKLSKSFRVE